MVNPKVFSFNAQKVKFKKTYKGIDFVEKVATKKEFKNICIAEKYLVKYPMTIKIKQKPINVRPAKVLGWDDKNSLLKLELCKGLNLESELKKQDFFNRAELLKLIESLFLEIRRIGFLWGDFAPRNMIYNSKKNEIGIFDFEKNTKFLNRTANDTEFSRFVHQYSMEEFACLLFPKEQQKLFGDLNLKKEVGRIKTNDINSARKKALLKLLFGKKSTYTLDKVVKVENIMRDIATPIKIDSGIVYSMELIEQIVKQSNVNNYARLAKVLFNKKGREKYEILKYFK